ncbi:uncharacterized protein LOC143773826 [Ranitomeya variabilis]|uniref:uncharacterized protein LOC143773826 n=1 Tax=Ranitomeya variabilis TaxID=490064 RepID=UPI004057610A
MKIAVIFLCVAIASFIDTSNGFSKGKSFDKTKADFYVRSSHAIGQKVEILKTCPEHEKETRKKCLLEDLFLEMNMLSIDLGLPLEEILELVGLPLDIVNNILAGKLDVVLNVINIEDLISPVFSVVEGCLATVGVVLKQQMKSLNSVLGSVTGVLSIVSGLHDTVEEILSSVTGSLLVNVLSVLPSLLGSLTGVLGKGLLG